MTTSLVLTFMGRDRPGIVNGLSEKIAAAGGNWLESRLSRLAGEFAGIALITVDEPDAESLIAALRGLEESGLRIAVERSSASTAASGRILELQLIGHDRPGIVRDVTQAVSRLGVNIETFASDIDSAPFTGETMFRAQLRLQLPEHVASEDVQQALEELAGEIMVDFTIGMNEGF